MRVMIEDMGQSILLYILLPSLTLYGTVVFWMWVKQERYIFRPKRYDIPPEFERFRWDRDIAGIRHQGWFIDKGKTNTVIYHGGNAEDLAGHCAVMMNGMDANILLVNYRGYGHSEGSPGEKAMVADSIALFDLFCSEKNSQPSTVFIMGRSLGSGIAVQVARARPQAAGLILVTPYESLTVLAKQRYPWLPVKLLLRHSFSAIEVAPHIQMPALVLLAELDEIIPVESGRKLSEHLSGEKKIIALPTGHYDIHEHPGYFGSINRFVNPL
ncbi:MAG: alpha/beta hydrolase [Kiritimatiellaceae bacterium]|nr:alpha/beta hydrolase [Kiritimatiellaceae bacterium]